MPFAMEELLARIRATVRLAYTLPQTNPCFARPG